MEFTEYDEIKLFSFHEYIPDDLMYGKNICSFIHEPENIYYFAYFRNLGHSIDRCRISMTKPEYLDSDFILTAEERNLIIKILTEYNIWNEMIQAEQEERKFWKINPLPDNMIMPDYYKLEIIDV